MVDKTDLSAKAVFVKFAEVPDGVQIIASSDAGIRRLKQNTFENYDAGCLALAKRMARRNNQPSALVCNLEH